MNTFDSHWQITTAAARCAEEETFELPFGFTTKVLAGFEKAPVETWGDLLSALGQRAVLTSAILFAASATLAIWQVDLMPLVPTWIEAPISPRIFLP
jgi:uncharacterized protein involved in response to NO